MKKRVLIVALTVLAAVLSYGAVGQLNVSVSNTGTVVGQTKELVISASATGVVSGTVQAFGTGVTLPACATAALPIAPAVSNTVFQDIAIATFNWGTTLASNADYELFFCIGNIGANSGIIHVSTTGQAVGETEIFEQASPGLTGLVFTLCDGATIAGNGVISVRGHLHTPTAGLNGVVALTGKTTFTFS